MEKDTKFNSPIFITLLLILIILCAFFLKTTASVVLPLVISVFFSLVLEPVIITLKKKFHIPWGLGITIVVTIVFICFFILGTLVFNSLRTIFNLYPKYEERFLYIYKAIADIFVLPFNEQNSLIENLWGQLGIRSLIQEAAVSLSTWIISFSRNFVAITLFTIFFLLELRFFRRKIELAFFDKEKARIGIIFTAVITQVTKYISTKFFISLTTGVLVYLGLLIIGMDFPIIWGFLAFILNFIPNFGSIISGLITIVFSLVQFYPHPGPVIYTGILVLSINMIIGNFFEPKIQGTNLGLSPFVIIASLSIWGWIWGFAGMILGVPMMVILKIIAENISFTKPLAIILGGNPDKKSPKK